MSLLPIDIWLDDDWDSPIDYRSIRYLIIRLETLYLFVFIPLLYVYLDTLLRLVLERVRGVHLERHDLQHHLHFNPPEFIDRGFSDLSKFDQFWKMRHNRFSYCASQAFRSYMEDRMHYMYDPNMNLAIFGIFDGHGGQYVSDYLEVNFARSIRERLMKSEPYRRLSIDSCDSLSDSVSEAIMREVIRIDDTISRLDQKYTSMTGSTCIAVIVENNRFVTVVNVGDSRAVACDMHLRCIPLSNDHKPDNPEERYRIEHSGGFVSCEDGTPRIQGILAVSRSFGDTFLKRLGVLTAQPDVLRIDLNTQPLKFLIVGTDGFWDVVSNEEAVELANFYLKSHGKKDWHRISTYLVKIALERRSADNVSVLFIKLE